MTQLRRCEPEAEPSQGRCNALTDRLKFAYLRGDGSPTDEFQGINREHGADDPIGAKAVTAPATVSGLSSVSAATGRQPLGCREGSIILQAASQETCRQTVAPVPGGVARGTDAHGGASPRVCRPIGRDP